MTIGPTVIFFLLLILLVAAVVGTLILITRSVRACLRWIRLRYSFDLHIPQMAYRSKEVMTRGRLLRKQARHTVKILESARRAHVELGVLPTGAGDYVDDAARVIKVRKLHCVIGVDNLLGKRLT
jgi:hypothetical protein